MRRLIGVLMLLAATTAPAMAQSKIDCENPSTWTAPWKPVPDDIICKLQRDLLEMMTPEGLQRRKLDSMLEQAGIKERQHPELLKSLPGMGGGGPPSVNTAPAARPPVDYAAPTR